MFCYRTFVIPHLQGILYTVVKAHGMADVAKEVETTAAVTDIDSEVPSKDVLVCDKALPSCTNDSTMEECQTIGSSPKVNPVI